MPGSDFRSVSRGLTPLRSLGLWAFLPLLALLTSAPLFQSGCTSQEFPQALVEVSRKWGIEFRHDNGMTGELYFCETVGPGSALFDIDGDGDLDLFVPQGNLLGTDKQVSDQILPPPADQLPGGRLFENTGKDDSGVPRFVDSTLRSGIEAYGYGMGCAVADVEGDGDLDLFLSCFGDDQLWINDGKGRFHEGAAAAGIDDDRWTTSALFVDVDGDGDEDLYVCSYIDFTLANHKPCYAESSAVEYCGPSSYPPLPDRLYRNRGDGTFEDVTSSSGIGAAPGAGLGVVCSDLDGDGELDFYVANDGMANRFWKQVAPFRFEDAGLLTGCAVNRDGRPEASMGADLADFDGDGDEDIFLTHLTGETNTLYRNDGKGNFNDETARIGLAVASRRWTGFGTAWFDLDNDGWLDLFITNGAVKRMEERVAAGDPYPLDQPDQVFVSRQGESFVELDQRRAKILLDAAVGRGAAFGDFDDDGDVDIVVTNNCGQIRVLENRQADSSHWIGADLRSPTGDVVSGIQVVVRQGSKPPRYRNSTRGGSYLCSNDPRVTVGLDTTVENCSVEVHWRDGNVETYSNLEIDQYHLLVQGQGDRS